MYDIRVNIRQFEIVQIAPNAVRVTVCEPKLSNNDELVNKSKLHLKKLLEYVLDSVVEMDFVVVDKWENISKKRRPIRREF